MMGSCRLMRDTDVLSMYGLVDVDKDKQLCFVSTNAGQFIMTVVQN